MIAGVPIAGLEDIGLMTLNTVSREVRADAPFQGGGWVVPQGKCWQRRGIGNRIPKITDGRERTDLICAGAGRARKFRGGVGAIQIELSGIKTKGKPSGRIVATNTIGAARINPIQITDKISGRVSDCE